VPLAVFPGCAVFPRWTLLKTVRFPAIPLLEFCLRVGLCPVPPSSRPAPKRRRSSSRGLLLPCSTSSQEGPLDRGLCRPATFRPQGLVTLAAVYSLQGLAGFVSRRQHSWEVPFGAFSSQEVPERFRPSELTYRFPQRFLRRPKAPARPDGSRFLSYTLLRIPGARMCV
jgi:hypothetical protein